MKTKLLALASVAALGFALPAHASIIINVNGKTNAGLPSSAPLANPVSVFLAQGSYLLTFTAPPAPGANFTAVNVWTRNGGPGVTGCDQNGANCAEGWFNRIEYFLDSSNANAALTLGSSSRPNRYSTAALSFANAGGYSAIVNVGAGGQNFSAFLRDTPITDNHGGISLSLASVPEPATWAMMIMGFGMIGGAYRSRRTTAKLNFA
jgi:PEP-CTERM motif